MVEEYSANDKVQVLCLGKQRLSRIAVPKFNVRYLLKAATIQGEKMKVFIISYRDEFRPDPLELVAFDDREKANKVVEALDAKRKELSKEGLSEVEMNRQWHAFLGTQQISENRFFVLNFTSYGNYAFNVRELEVLS